MNPYDVAGRPLLVSFSGGRTSALMTGRFIDRGDLRRRVHEGTAVVAFANTGKERPETLDFVRDVQERWSLPVRWVERTPGGGFREVTHESAARDGEPYTALVTERNFLPNPVARFCTTELKIRPMKALALSLGWDRWTNAVGIRADEPRRVAKYKAREAGGEERNRERWESVLPLAQEGVTVEDVARFWDAQPFDLRLQPWEGNCDLCFLKGIARRQRIMRDRPDLAPWWIEREAQLGGTFRADAPPYAALLARVGRQPLLPLVLVESADPTDLGDCTCTD